VSLSNALTRFAWVLIVLALLVGPIAGILASEKFQYCYDHQGEYPTTQNEADKAPAIHLPRSVGGVRYR
jgi:hypothetical protein